MEYIEVSFVIKPVNSDNREIIAALLGEIEFESFSDTKVGLNAYIQAPLFDEQTMNEALQPFKPALSEFKYNISTIKEQNWNADWEKSFSPIIISDKCRIRAPFHSSEGNFEYDLIIEPKMSFGTGHHATTTLMINLLIDMDLHGKSVLDMGCGTGILAILAALRKADKIMAIDIDKWSYENTLENAERNKVPHIQVVQGDASVLPGQHFDIILANINRNILLNDMSYYANCLSPNGQLLLSGFYSQDLPAILDKAKDYGLKYYKHIEQENWIAVNLIMETI